LLAIDQKNLCLIKTRELQRTLSSVPPAMVARYLAGAFLNLLKWWIEAEMPYSPERMDEIFQQLALPGVWATLERKSE
jgi:hypothetical protein